MRGMRNFYFFPGSDFLERIGKIYWIEIFHFTEQNTFISLLILGVARYNFTMFSSLYPQIYYWYNHYNKCSIVV